MSKDGQGNKGSLKSLCHLNRHRIGREKAPRGSGFQLYIQNTMIEATSMEEDEHGLLSPYSSPQYIFKGT